MYRVRFCLSLKIQLASPRTRPTAQHTSWYRSLYSMKFTCVFYYAYAQRWMVIYRLCYVSQQLRWWVWVHTICSVKLANTSVCAKYRYSSLFLFPVYIMFLSEIFLFFSLLCLVLLLSIFDSLFRSVNGFLFHQLMCDEPLTFRHTFSMPKRKN